MNNKTTPFLTVIIVCLLAATSTMGQSRFSLAATVTPGYQSRNFAIEESLGGLKGTGSYASISAGITAHYAFTPKWSLSVGFLYNHTSGDTRYTNSTELSTLSTQNKNLQVPVLLNYASSSRRLSPYFSVGLLTNYHSVFGHDDLTAYAMIGLGAQYKLSSKLSLIVQPTAAYRLGQPSPDYTHFNDYLLGLQTQLKFTF